MRTDSVKVYEPNQRAKMGFVKSWVAMARSVSSSRELVWQLFKRDFISNYKQSLLGVAWLFISPVVAIVSWVFLNAAGVLKPGDTGVPYPVYVLLGSTIWGLFMGFFTSTSRSLADSGSLILQINFPHEVLVVKQVAQTVASFFVNIVLILLVLAIYRVTPSWGMLLLPLAVMPLLFFGAGVGMIVAVVSAVVHDAEKAASAMLGFVMYLTPVIYAPKAQGGLIQAAVYWNPLSYLVAGARDVIIHGRVSDPGPYAFSCALSFVFFVVSWRVFFLSEYKVAEKL